MKMDRKALSRIKEVLKVNPRGMNVTEVAGEIKMNRQSVAKYLEMLVISGHVDVRSFGPSKVYYLSQRMPISAMLSLSFDFIILLDKQLKVLNVNDRFLEFSGISRDDILYKSVDHLAFPIQFEPSIMPNIKEALQGIESSAEAYYKKKGRESFYNVKFIPMVLDDGEKGVTVIFENITERKENEKAIRESEQKFRVVIEQSQEGFILTDESGKVIEFNRAMEQISGMGREEAIGKQLWDVELKITTQDKNFIYLYKNLKSLMANYMKTGKATLSDKIFELDILHPDGMNNSVQISYFIINSEKGRMLCITVRDITSKKRIEDAIKESEEKFRSVIEQSTDGIMLSDERGIITKYNSAMERITGIGRQEVLGRQMLDVHQILLKNSPQTMRRLHDMPHRIEAFLNTDASTHINRIMEVDINPPGMLPKKVQVNIYNITTKKGTIACASIRDVTELKKAETELRESRQRSVILADAAEDFIYIIDRDLRIEYLNQSSARLIGKTTAELIGQPIRVMFQEENYEHVKKNLLRVIETGESMSIEHMTMMDDRKYWMSVMLNPINDNDGDKPVVKSVVSIARDITARKQMEEELRKSRDELEARIQDRTGELERANKALKVEIDKRKRSEEALQESQQIISTIVGTLPGIVYKSNAQKGWALEFISDGCRELTGFEPSELLGKSYDSSAPLIHPENVGVVKNSVKEALDARRPFRIKYRIVKANGELRWVLEQGRGVYDPDGKLTHVDGFISDITETVKIEAALQKSEEKYRSLVESVSDGVWETGKDIRFTYVSPRICEIMGYKPDHILGKTPYDLMSPEEAERVKIVMQPSEIDGNPFSLLEFETRRADGSRIILEVGGDPIIDEHGNLMGFRGIARDVTRRRAHQK